MSRIAIITILLFLALPAGAMDWYISPSSPFVSRTIEGTQCRYLRVTSADSGYSPALKTDKVVYTRISYDSNVKATGSPALVSLKACTDNSSTPCASFLADMDGNGVDEAADLSVDVTFTDTAAPAYLRALITTAAVSPAAGVISVCGAISGPPVSNTETDPIFRAMNTEAELEAQLGGLNVWTFNDGPLGGGGGGSGYTNLSSSRTTTNITIFSDTGDDAVVGSATTSLAGVMSAADKTKLDGIEAGATNDDVPESGDFGEALGLEADGSISVGAVSIASIGATGTPSGSTFLRGDGTWSVPIGATNISQGTRTATTVAIDSSTGTSGTLSAATTSLAGLFSAADKTKLDGIATGATVGLGANPAACGAGLVATDIAQDGTLTCTADNVTPITNSITLAMMTDDSVGIAELTASGTPDGTTFLRGDNVWATPAGGGGGLSNIVDDATPELGAELDALNNKIKNLKGLSNRNWYVDTSAEWDTAISECATNVGPSGETVGGTIVITDAIEKDCSTQANEAGKCFALPTTYRRATPDGTTGSDLDWRTAQCKLTTIGNPQGLSSSVALYDTSPGLTCLNTKDMTGVTIGGELVKGCLGFGGNDQVIDGVSINTSTGSDNATRGIVAYTPTETGSCPGVDCVCGDGTCGVGERQMADITLHNIAIRTEDPSLSGSALGTAGILGGRFDGITMSGYSRAGWDPIDNGYNNAFNNEINFTNSRFNGLGVGILLDEGYDSQSFNVHGVMESNGINIHIGSASSTNFTADIYSEGSAAGAYPSTDGILIENASTNAIIKGTDGGTFSSSAIRRTASPTTQDDTIDVKHYGSQTINYPAGGGYVRGGDLSHSIAVKLPGSSARPGTCAVNQIYIDPTETSGQRVFVCETTNNWVLQGDGGGTGFDSLFDDPAPTVSANLDMNNLDIVNPDRVGNSIYFAKTQAEAEAALVRCGKHYGSANSTGCTIQLACGPIAWDDFEIGAPNDGNESHSGVHIRGCGPGGLMAANGVGAGGSTTLQASQATPMISLYSCASCKISNLVLDGNNIATGGIVYGDTGSGFPSTQNRIEDSNVTYINGPAIQTGYNELAILTLTRIGTTATATVAGGTQLIPYETLEIFGASDSNFNGSKIITIVDATTFTYTVANTGATSATGAKMTSHLASRTQVDSLDVHNVILQYNDSCYEQIHGQSIGMIFKKVTCANSNGTGDVAGIDIQAGEFEFDDGYFGAANNGDIFINRSALAARITVRNNQTEWHGTTGGYLIKDDDTSMQSVGASTWASAIVDGNAVVYAGAMNCFSVKREGSYQVTNNIFFNQGSAGEICASNFASDEDPYPQDRLTLTQYGNIETQGGGTPYPETWKPTLAADVILSTPTIANNTAPNDCLNGQIWVDKNGTTGQRIYTCESGAWVADNSKTINTERLVTSHSVDLTSIFAPFNVSSNSFKNWYAIDGAKNLCTDIYDTPASGGGTQTSDVSAPAGDGYCDVASSVKAGKTKVFSSKYDIASFMQTEGYGSYTLMTTGGDQDSVGNNIDLHCLGGARDYGDEGCQIDRRFVSDTYYNATGNLSGSLSGGAGTGNIAITGLQETGGRQAGEGKYVVFDSHASARNVTISVAATSAIGTGGVWTLGSGDVGTVGPGWCFTSRLATSTDVNGLTVYQYYPIVSVNSGANQITTSWFAQGDDMGIPTTYRSTVGAPSGTVGGRVAPCVEIKRPQFGTDYVIDSLDIEKGSSFPGTAVNEPFAIAPYANHRTYSYNAIVAEKLGHRNEGFAFGATNLLDGTYGQRRFLAGLTVGYNGNLANLTDGWYTGFDDGIRCTAGGCQNGIRMDYQDITSYQSLGEVDFGNTRWAAPNNDQMKVITVLDDQTFNLTVGRLTGWGMDGDPFIRSSQLNTIAELHTQLGLTGTRDGTKFLRDDGSWQTVSGGSGSGDPITIESAPITNAAGVEFAAGIGLKLPLTAGAGLGGSDLVVPGFDYTSYPQIDHPGMAARTCVFTSEGTGAGGFICEGTATGLTEPLFSFPAINTNTTNWIVTSPAQIMFAGPTAARTITVPDANLTVTTAGAAILDDADTATQRTTLGAQTANAELDFLTNNCGLTNTGTPIPDACVGDGVDGGGAGSAIIFDIGDDGGNDSINITEIATSGDVNGVFSEPTADKLSINLNADWPKADQADSLAANGANCPAGSYPLGVSGVGAAEVCTVDDDVPESGDFGAATDIDATGAVRVNAVALGTDTTGGYAGSATEGGAATTATALAANGGNCPAGTFPLGVDASGAIESCTDVVLPSEVSAYTVSASSPVDGTNLCTAGDTWLNESSNKIYYCVDSATDEWFGVQLVDEP